MIATHATTTTLHDITDVQAFAYHHLQLTGLELAVAEREELHAEAVALLYEMAERWNGEGWFSGYASRYLPGRIISAWRKLHREHAYRTAPDGSREWVWGRTPDSLDRPLTDTSHMTLADTILDPRGSLGAAPDAEPLELVMRDVPAGTYLGTPVHLLLGDDDALASTVRSALAGQLEDEIDLHLRVSVMAAAGMSRAQIRSHLGLSADDVRAIFGRLRRCAHLMDPNVRRAA